jgi:phosphoribosylglycinamide formyltransferase-1
VSTPIAVLISGSGSNLQALIEACKTPGYPARIVLVLSNKADAHGLTRAGNAGIATGIISHKDYADRETFDAALDAAIRQSGAQFVCLAGFMRVLTPGFTERWQGRMINIHPSLLPSFKGMRTHRDALEAGVRIHGCSVHYVVPEMDSGPIIMQAAVPVKTDDTPETLAARVLEAEHILYPLALRKALRPDEALPDFADTMLLG